jgi:hypothetical protein
MALTYYKSIEYKNQDPLYKFWLNYIVKDVVFHYIISLYSYLFKNRNCKY